MGSCVRESCGRAAAAAPRIDIEPLTAEGGRYEVSDVRLLIHDENTCRRGITHRASLIVQAERNLRVHARQPIAPEACRRTLIPGLIGVLLAAPFISDLEHGTYRLAWTQSITRGRWLLGKLGLPVSVALLCAGALILLFTWWRTPNVHINGHLDTGDYDTTGTVVSATPSSRLRNATLDVEIINEIAVSRQRNRTNPPRFQAGPARPLL